MDYVELKAEIVDDPMTLGLGFDDTGATAEKLNRVGGGAGYEVEPARVSWEDVQGCVDPAEYSALSEQRRDAWAAIISHESIPVQQAGIRDQIGLIWTAAESPNTRVCLIALQKRQGSRAEVLFGEGVVVTHDDVAKARDL